MTTTTSTTIIVIIIGISFQWRGQRGVWEFKPPPPNEKCEFFIAYN